MTNPYNDKYIDGKTIRSFSRFVENTELIWHRDKKDREVKVLYREVGNFNMTTNYQDL